MVLLKVNASCNIITYATMLLTAVLETLLPVRTNSFKYSTNFFQGVCRFLLTI